MSGYQPTKQQQTAISTRNSDVFVSAAAGSGKTRAMTERFAEAVIIDKIPVDQILTITFTKEAAAQLQEKIRSRLSEAGMIDESRRVPDAYISNFHSFCARILRAHPFAAGIDPHFIILEEVQTKSLAKETIDETISIFANRSESHLAFIHQAGRNNVSDTTIGLFEKLRSEGYLRPVEGVPKISANPRDPSEINKLTYELINEINSVIKTGDRNSDKATYLNNFKVIEDLLAHLEIHETGTHEYSILPGLVKSFKINTQANLSKQVFGRVIDLIAAIDEALREDAAYRYNGFFTELLDDFAALYTKKKADISGLDFEDLQLEVKKLFMQHPEIRESYRQKFKLIMVDEFQDTNRLQCDIVDSLANHNVFTVGDEFQSIYLFRHADVSVFRGLREKIGADAGLPIEFPENFRSRKEVLAFINNVGKSDKFFGDNHLHLVPGRNADSFKGTNNPAVEVAIVDTNWEEIDHAKAEANYIAMRIHKLLSEGIYDLNDIAILIPKRTKLKQIEDALKDHEISYITVGGQGYHGTDESAEIKDLLSIIVNPFDDLSLIGTLRGPCFRLSDDALYLIRKAAGKVDGNNAPLWNAIEHFIDNGNKTLLGLAKSDLDKLLRFLDIFNELRLYASGTNLSSLIEKAVCLTGYDLCALMRDNNGISRMANIRKLMRMADSFEELHGTDLSHFVRYLSLQKDLSVKESEAAFVDENIGAVRIMTVHGSKGLQFPVVFLALSNGDPSKGGPRGVKMALYRTAKESVNPTPSSLAYKVAGMNGFVDTLNYSDLKKSIDVDESDEQKRLLHVAITRAEEHLFVTGTCNLDIKNLAKAQKNSYIEWFMAALNLGHYDLRDSRDAGVFNWIDDNGVDYKIVCNASHPIHNPISLSQPISLESITDINIDNLGMSLGAGNPAERAKISTASKLQLKPQLPIDLSPVNMTNGIHAQELSYTSIETYLRCPREFYLRNIVGVNLNDMHNHNLVLAADQKSPEPANTSVPAATLGIIAHRIFETIDISMLTHEGISAIIDDIEGILTDYPELDESDRERIIDIIGKFASSGIAARLAKTHSIQSIQKEVPFSFLLQDTVISGKIDALAHENGHILILDYKTGSKSTDLKDLEKKYSLQMDLYALALLKNGAESIEVIMVALENNSQTVNRVYKHNDIALHENKLAEIVKDINQVNQMWAFTSNSSICEYCRLARFCRLNRIN